MDLSPEYAPLTFGANPDKGNGSGRLGEGISLCCHLSHIRDL